MRLSSSQVEAIQRAFQEVFGKGRVVLFGSRLDDMKRGGDIDLYLIPQEKGGDPFGQKISFLTRLKQMMGDQKIDVLIEGATPAYLVEEVERKGQLLCSVL